MQRLVYGRVSIKIYNTNLVVLASVIFRTLCYDSTRSVKRIVPNLLNALQG